MTIRILFGHRARPFRMYATRHYRSEEILCRLQGLVNRAQPLYLLVENTRIQLGANDLRLASEVAVAYHNETCYNVPPDDGWDNETARMEQAAEQHMHDPPSEDSDDAALSDGERLF